MRTIALAGITAMLAVPIVMTGSGSGPASAQSNVAAPKATPTAYRRSPNQTITINGTAMTVWNPQAVDANGNLVAKRYQSAAECKAAGGAVIAKEGYQQCRFATVGVGH